MDFAVIAITALLASALTLYSGFGLGTVLLPAFALFFPVPTAVAATAVVHLLNSLFKGALLWRDADWKTVLRFGLPAVPGAVAGGWLLSHLGETERGAGLIIGLLLIVFALLELQPWFQRLKAPPRLMPLGGVATGFLGGLTGQQGALRSIFLLKAGLDARRFVATGVLIAVLIDLSRLTTYAAAFSEGLITPSGREGLLVLTGTLAAFAGAYLGTRYLHKATIGAVRLVVAALMLAIGGAMAAGLVGA